MEIRKAIFECKIKGDGSRVSMITDDFIVSSFEELFFEGYNNEYTYRIRVSGDLTVEVWVNWDGAENEKSITVDDGEVGVIIDDDGEVNFI